MSDLLRADLISYTPPGRETPLYRDFSFSLHKGDFLLMAGSNGSGKSTLLKLLCGFLKPEKGEVTLLGKPCRKWKEKERSDHIGYVPQGLPLFTGFTVRELVTAGRSSHTPFGAFLSRKDREKIMEAMEAMDLSALADRPLSALSGGECRRASIAAILARSPSILLLDEPTAALDFYHGQKLMLLLEKYRKERGVTIAMTAHDLLIPVPFAARVVLLKEGRIIKDGTPEETLTSEELYKAFHCHFEVGRSSGGVMTFSLQK